VDQTQKQALQVTKEIVVKFIETNRISPTNFPDLFKDIYQAVLLTIRWEENKNIQENGCKPDSSG